MENKRVSIINLGCKANKYEADAMADKLRTAGFRLVDSEDVADIYIVNTCSVTNVAEKKSRQMLRRAKKRNPDTIVVAAGCYVNAAPDKLKEMDFVDLVIGNNRKKDIVEVLRQYFAKETIKDNYIDINHTNEFEEMGAIEASVLRRQRAYIKIQDGCNQFCSYCIIPYTRGRVRSRKPEYVLAEIEKLAKEGVKEFVLTGIHISSYGMDFEDVVQEYDDAFSGDRHCNGNIRNESDDSKKVMIRNLGGLIHAISMIPEVIRIRLGSLEPRIITEDFLNIITENDKVCPHFHLSLQSGCNDTLKRMNRKYTIEEFEEKCKLLRRYYNHPAITTDIIVGFPGETEEEFCTTVDSLQRLNLYEFHVFKYSVRTGTAAEKMPNQVSEQIKNERSNRLLELTARQKHAYERAYRGRKEEVLIEETISVEDSKGLVFGRIISLEETDKMIHYYTGHTRNYMKVVVASERDLINSIVEVEIL